MGLFFFCCLAMQAQPRTLSLEECLQNAATRNRTLQNAALEIQKAGEQKKEAFTKYFPEISANVMAFHAFDKMVKADGYYPQELRIFLRLFHLLSRKGTQHQILLLV